VAPDSGFFVITSRCSFEMVAKVAIFGSGTLVSVSAPTSLALERAQRFGVRLIAVARFDQALCFDSGKNDASGGLAA
jgi:FdhD protein